MQKAEGRRQKAEKSTNPLTREPVNTPTRAPANTLTDQIDSSNLTGLTSSPAWDKQAYYQQYRKSFQQGEYRQKDTVMSSRGPVIRSYTSGGIQAGALMQACSAVTANEVYSAQLPKTLSGKPGYQSYRVSGQGQIVIEPDKSPGSSAVAEYPKDPGDIPGIADKPEVLKVARLLAKIVDFDVENNRSDADGVINYSLYAKVPEYDIVLEVKSSAEPAAFLSGVKVGLFEKSGNGSPQLVAVSEFNAIGMLTFPDSKVHHESGVHKNFCLAVVGVPGASSSAVEEEALKSVLEGLGGFALSTKPRTAKSRVLICNITSKNAASGGQNKMDVEIELKKDYGAVLADTDIILYPDNRDIPTRTGRTDNQGKVVFTGVDVKHGYTPILYRLKPAPAPAAIPATPEIIAEVQAALGKDVYVQYPYGVTCFSRDRKVKIEGVTIKDENNDKVMDVIIKISYSNQPVKGITVRLGNGVVKKTDSNGQVKFDEIEVYEFGMYHLSYPLQVVDEPTDSESGRDHLGEIIESVNRVMSEVPIKGRTKQPSIQAQDGDVGYSITLSQDTPGPGYAVNKTITVKLLFRDKPLFGKIKAILLSSDNRRIGKVESFDKNGTVVFPDVPFGRNGSEYIYSLQLVSVDEEKQRDIMIAEVKKALDDKVVKIGNSVKSTEGDVNYSVRYENDVPHFGSSYRSCSAEVKIVYKGQPVVGVDIVLEGIGTFVTYQDGSVYVSVARDAAPEDLKIKVGSSSSVGAQDGLRKTYDGRRTTEDGRRTTDFGGIDARYLLIEAQVKETYADIQLPALSELLQIDLGKEAARINNMYKAEVIPASSRIISFICACYLKPKNISQAMGCMLDYFQVEEKCLLKTPEEMKQFLVLIQSQRIEPLLR